MLACTAQYGCIPVVLSDDLVWAYSTEAGGPLDPSTFSIQLPQSTVLKTAEFILSRIASENDPKPARKGANAVSYSAALMNGGKALPSGVMVTALLQEIAAEDALLARAAEATNATQSGTSRRLFEKGTSNADIELLELQHRYLLNENQDTAKPSKGNKAAKAAARAGKAASADTAVISNTLIRLLQKISARDIALLQEGVRNASRYYQFYPMDANMRTDVTPPAVHAYPSGGAMQMLGQLLEQRVKRGVGDIHHRCQVLVASPCVTICHYLCFFFLYRTVYWLTVTYIRTKPANFVCCCVGGARQAGAQVYRQLPLREATEGSVGRCVLS